MEFGNEESAVAVDLRATPGKPTGLRSEIARNRDPAVVVAVARRATDRRRAGGGHQPL